MIYKTTRKLILLMAWKCRACKTSRGYLLPRTTRDRTAWLECLGTCSGHSPHDNEFRCDKFAVELLRA